MSSFLDIKNQVAAYLGRTAVADLNPSALTPAGININLGTFAVNEAALRIQRMVDFVHAESTGDISIASTGTALSAVTGLAAGSTIKRVMSILLPVAGSEYFPIEFLTEEEWTKRIKRAMGRATYNATATLADLGFSQSSPVAYQKGASIYLAPSNQFTFPVAAKIDVVRFMPPYSADADTDFLTNIGPDYLLWAAIVEINKFFRRNLEKTEGSVVEESIIQYRDETQAALVKWNEDVRKGTTTPPDE